jgi:hypothetical protein
MQGDWETVKRHSFWITNKLDTLLIPRYKRTEHIVYWTRPPKIRLAVHWAFYWRAYRAVESVTSSAWINYLPDGLEALYAVNQPLWSRIQVSCQILASDSCYGANTLHLEYSCDMYAVKSGSSYIIEWLKLQQHKSQTHKIVLAIFKVPSVHIVCLNRARYALYVVFG